MVNYLTNVVALALVGFCNLSLSRMSRVVLQLLLPRPRIFRTYNSICQR